MIHVAPDDPGELVLLGDLTGWVILLVGLIGPKELLSQISRNCGSTALPAVGLPGGGAFGWWRNPSAKRRRLVELEQHHLSCIEVVKPHDIAGPAGEQAWVAGSRPR